MDDAASAPKRMGRPKGAKNREKPKPPPRLDPEQLIEHQLQLLAAVQSALSTDFKRSQEGGEKWVDGRFVMSLNRHSQAISKAIESLRKSTDVAEEMAKRMTPEQLLDAALRKIETQDTATINYAIRRLRAHREMSPVQTAVVSAGQAIADLEESDDDDSGPESR